MLVLLLSMTTIAPVSKSLHHCCPVWSYVQFAWDSPSLCLFSHRPDQCSICLGKCPRLDNTFYDHSIFPLSPENPAPFSFVWPGHSFLYFNSTIFMNCIDILLPHQWPPVSNRLYTWSYCSEALDIFSLFNGLNPNLGIEDFHILVLLLFLQPCLQCLPDVICGSNTVACSASYTLSYASASVIQLLKLLCSLLSKTYSPFKTNSTVTSSREISLLSLPSINHFYMTLLQQVTSELLTEHLAQPTLHSSLSFLPQFCLSRWTLNSSRARIFSYNFSYNYLSSNSHQNLLTEGRRQHKIQEKHWT